MRQVEGGLADVCPACGGEAFRPETRREQFVRWFSYGAGAGSAWYCRSCRASWSGGSSYVVLSQTSGSGWRRRARLPVDVLEAVRDARTWHPVPRFYAAVGTVALVPALAIAVLPGVRRWATVVGVPVAAMVGAFLWSMATAVGRGRDVFWRLAPERAQRQDLEEELTAVREQVEVFPLLVPAGWPGALSLDGAEWSIPPRGPRVLQGVLVVADLGDPLLAPDQLLASDRQLPGGRPPTPRVEIRYSRIPWDVAEDRALDEFIDRAIPALSLDLDVDQVDRREMERRMLAAEQDEERRRQRWAEELADRWRDGHVLVDGVATPARLLTLDEVEVGVATFVCEGEGVLIVAEGIDLDTLALVRVADPIALVDAFELRRRRILDRSDG